MSTNGASAAHLSDLIQSPCDRCGRRAMLMSTGRGTGAECPACYDAWHRRPRWPARPKVKPDACRHGVSATTRLTDGTGAVVVRTTCQQCGRVERAVIPGVPA